MAKKAITTGAGGYYHNAFAKPLAVVVLKVNDDNTYDIGAKSSTRALVTKCPISLTAKAGHFTPGDLPDDIEKAAAMLSQVTPNNRAEDGVEATVPEEDLK